MKNLCYKIPLVAILILSILISHSCKHKKKIVLSEKDFPADSIKKWTANSDSINRENTLFADKNPYKFTDSVRKVEKPKNVFRIAALGDSFIWGDGLPYKKVWSHKLENKLCSKYQNLELMSWGICGWSTLIEYNFFVKEGYKYDNDLLIVGWVENDPDMGKPRLQGQSENDWLHSLYTQDNLKEYGALLKEVSALQGKYGIKLLFVMTPICIYKENEEWKDKVTALLDEAGNTYLDLYPLFKKKFEDIPCRNLFATPLNGHPGDKLSSFISDEVMKYLEKNKYLFHLKAK